MLKKEMKENYKTRKIIGGVYRIKCSGNGTYWLKKAKEIDKAMNRFQFAVATNNVPEPAMKKDWYEFGKDYFELEVLETLEMKESQTDSEFKADLKTLLEIWELKLESEA